MLQLDKIMAINIILCRCTGINVGFGGHYPFLRSWKISQGSNPCWGKGGRGEGAEMGEAHEPKLNFKNLLP